MLAAGAEVYPTAAQRSITNDWPAEEFADIRKVAEATEIGADELIRAAKELVGAEVRFVLPAVESLELNVRRRMGKVFRMRRDANLRNGDSGSRRRRSQTELYEMARRAGVEHRSSMTQAQLQEALEARSRRQ